MRPPRVVLCVWADDLTAGVSLCLRPFSCSQAHYVAVVSAAFPVPLMVPWEGAAGLDPVSMDSVDSWILINDDVSHTNSLKNLMAKLRRLDKMYAPSLLMYCEGATRE